MLNERLSNYTNEYLSRYTNSQLEQLTALAYIWDRTQQDVERWRELRDKGWDNMTDTERKEWLGETVPTPAASRGMYTHNDMNRVEGAVKDIAARLTTLGYSVPSLTTKTNWTYTDKVTKEDMDRHLSNVDKLRSISGVLSSTPATPNTNKNFDYLKANDLEKIIDDIVSIIGGIS